MRSDTVLRPRQDSALTASLARSAAATGAGAGMATGDVARWFAARAAAHRFEVERIPFSAMDAWSFQPGTGNLVHRSGRFFSVEGLHAMVDEGPFREWHQPIIVQPEIGILGILAKEFDGVLHFLMQAKAEPGNPNVLQLSPTVQATRSNYTRVHRGTSVRYLEHFTRTGDGRVLADVLQSEHGSWFFRKSNRNVIMQTGEDVPPDDDYCWLTLGQIGELLRRDNLVNMDSRTVLACLPGVHPGRYAMHSDTDVLSWFTHERSRHQVRAHRIPLAGVRNWIRDGSAIRHALDRYFRVIAVSVRASNREVTGWTQPMIEPVGVGIAAFVVRRFHGVPHLLAHARVEGGFLDTVELGPTVQYTPEFYDHLPATARPPFLDLVLHARPAQIRYAATHAEEGGRFWHAQSRYLIVEASGTEAPPVPPPSYRWVTPGQLNSLVRHGHYLNVQARTLLALLNTGAVEI